MSEGFKSPFEIPGFADAILKENLIRDSAFLPLTEKLGPFDVMPLNLFHFTVLRIARSPFIPPFDTPSATELAAFLWVLQPDFAPANERGRKRFLKRCRYFNPVGRWTARATATALQHLAVLTKLARAYVEEALMDRPPTSTRTGYDPQYYSDACFYAALMGREYGWSYEVTLRAPLKALFQLLNEIKEHHTPKDNLILFNPISGKVISDHLKALNDRN